METATNDKQNSSLNQRPEGVVEPSPVVVRREPERDLVAWIAPSRPFKKYGRRFYITIFSIVGLISIVLFIAEGIMPVILLTSLIFLFYVLSTVKPEDIEYKVTSRGVKVDGKETPWQEMKKFSFLSKSGGEVVAFDTFGFPGRMEIVVKPEIKDKLKTEVSAYIPYETIQPSFLDKLTNWVVKKLPDSE